MVELNQDQFKEASARGVERLRGPRAESAYYDAGRDRVIVRLTTGIEIGFAPRDAEGLQHASQHDLSAIEIDALGLGLHFPQLDADLYVPALLEGVLGPRAGWRRARVRAANEARALPRRHRRIPTRSVAAGQATDRYTINVTLSPSRRGRSRPEREQRTSD